MEIENHKGITVDLDKLDTNEINEILEAEVDLLQAKKWEVSELEDEIYDIEDKIDKLKQQLDILDNTQ